MIELLITILVVVFVIAIVLWLLPKALANIPIDGTARNIIMAVVILILLIWALWQVGVLRELGITP
jgi:hypothetical protein